MSKALITGGAGFVGLHLARELVTRGWRVDVLDNFSRGARDAALREICSLGATLHDRNLLAAESVHDLASDYTHIFHFAAIIGVANVLERPFAVLRDNVLMLERILALCGTQTRLERLVFASTSEIYAGTLQYFGLPIPTPEDVPLAVTDLAHPRTSYMLSKLYGEAMCRQAGLPVTIIRPHNIYGPRMGMAHVIPELLRKAHRAAAGDPLPVFSATHRRTFCHVDDAVQMVRLAAESPSCRGEVLNVGAQSPEIAMSELGELIARVVGKSLRIVPQPDTPGSPARRCPDMSRTLRLTGYSAKIGLEDGIRATYNWYRPLLDA